MTDGTEARNGMLGVVPADTISDHPPTATVIIAAASPAHDDSPPFRVATAIIAAASNVHDSRGEKWCSTGRHLFLIPLQRPGWLLLLHPMYMTDGTTAATLGVVPADTVSPQRSGWLP